MTADPKNTLKETFRNIDKRVAFVGLVSSRHTSEPRDGVERVSGRLRSVRWFSVGEDACASTVVEVRSPATAAKVATLRVLAVADGNGGRPCPHGNTLAATVARAACGAAGLDTPETYPDGVRESRAAVAARTAFAAAEEAASRCPAATKGACATLVVAVVELAPDGRVASLCTASVGDSFALVVTADRESDGPRVVRVAAATEVHDSNNRHEWERIARHGPTTDGSSRASVMGETGDVGCVFFEFGERMAAHRHPVDPPEDPAEVRRAFYRFSDTRDGAFQPTVLLPASTFGDYPGPTVRDFDLEGEAREGRELVALVLATDGIAHPGDGFRDDSGPVDGRRPLPKVDRRATVCPNLFVGRGDHAPAKRAAGRVALSERALDGYARDVGEEDPEGWTGYAPVPLGVDDATAVFLDLATPPLTVPPSSS